MSLVEVNWAPTDRQLRQFGIICLVALPLIGWLWGGAATTIGILAAIGLLLAVLGMLIPRSVKPVFLLLTLIATPIGLVVGEAAMMLIYFGVFLPIATVFRIMKRDALQLRLDRQRETYWQAKSQPKNAASYYRQS